jgi:alkylated DNA repair protein (DNA oxidative demethylase)
MMIVHPELRDFSEKSAILARMQPGLFDISETSVAPGVVLLRDHAQAFAGALITAVETIAAAAPFQHMVTPGGFTMSAALTNCGAGWISDRKGYRYSDINPQTGEPWPAIPALFSTLAKAAVGAAGYADFIPDACIINRYIPGARMSLHTDSQEQALDAPVVSVSLGLSATFLWGGTARSDRPQRIALHHGDVIVWGGPSRLNFHGIAPLKPGTHPSLGAQRINLTFRRAYA